MENLEKVLYQVKPPCPKCPYKLGQVHTLMNPCPQCKLNGYQAYERFKKQTLREYMDTSKEERTENEK